MIDSVLELVNNTTSNSLFMFLFCNFIIILILMANSKPDFEDKPNPGSMKSVTVSDSVLSFKHDLDKSVMISESTLYSKPGFEKFVLFSESTLSSKPGLVKSGLNSKSVPTFKPGFEKSGLKSKSVFSSNPGFEISESTTLISKLGLEEPWMICKSSLSSKSAGSEQSLTSKPGSKKDEKESLEENESEAECALRRRVEEFIRKVNTQWKSENTNKSNCLL